MPDAVSSVEVETQKSFQLKTNFKGTSSWREDGQIDRYCEKENSILAWRKGCRRLSFSLLDLRLQLLEKTIESTGMRGRRHESYTSLSSKSLSQQFHEDRMKA